jgi:hypothetical protein
MEVNWDKVGGDARHSGHAIVAMGKHLYVNWQGPGNYEFALDSRIEDQRTDSHSNSTRRCQLTDIF